MDRIIEMTTTNKRVLWVNPSFLDYRIPLYTEMLNIGRKTEFANGWITIPFPKGLYKMICNVRPDLLIAEGFFQFTPWAVIYAFLHRKPLLIAYERTAHTERNCPLWRRLYRQFIGLFVSGYVVNGQLTKEYLMTQGVKEKNIFTGAMCADSEGLAAKVTALQHEEIDRIRSSIFRDKSSGITFLFVGRMISLKGIDYLIKGWNKHIAISNWLWEFHQLSLLERSTTLRYTSIMQYQMYSSSLHWRTIGA